MASLKYWIWLSALRGVGPRKAGALLDRFGTPENIHAAFEEDYNDVRELNLTDKRQLMNKSLDEAERILETCARKKIEILTVQDADYPDRLKNINSPPPVLYIRGRLPNIDDEVAVAIVGSRRCTAYGLRAAEKISTEICRGGGIVISGMARGIDSAAHLGAINVGSPTVAVLGCGVDVCYPKDNRRLMESIICTGAVMSEYPPGVEPEAGNFPPRNRIISGLSVGVVVIEAPVHSGALITANRALEQNRDVFAVPGNIDAANNEGVNNLIKDGAKLVTSGADVLCEYIYQFPHRITMSEAYSIVAEWQREKYGYSELEARSDAVVVPPDADKILSGLKEKVSEEEYKLLEAIREASPHIDAIIEKSEISASKALSYLTILEIKGVVTQLPGKRFALTEVLSNKQQDA